MAFTWQSSADLVAQITDLVRTAQQAGGNATVQAQIATSAAQLAVAEAAAIAAMLPQVPWVVTGAWTPGVNYTTGPPPSYVVYDGIGYVCNTNHLSGGILSPTYWTIAVDPTSSIASFFAGLPSSEPGSAGVVWNNGGVVCIS